MSRRDRRYEADLSQLQGDDADVPASADLRERILAATRPGQRFLGFSDRVQELFELDDGHTRDLLRTAADGRDASWFEAGPHVLAMNFDAGGRFADAHCGAVRIDPGAVFPLHRHVDGEWIFVLGGEGEDSLGRALRAGELLFSEPGSEHEVRCTGEEPLVFLAAAFGGIDRTR